jgi:hypothetical protein
MNLSIQIQNNQWGPALWMILHSTCERIGSKNLKRLPLEESRIWFGLLQSLRYSLPCPQCKKHYTTYSNQTPIMMITRDIIRKWLFDLHDQVNQHLQKTSIPFNEVSITYEVPFNFTEHYKILVHHMTASVRRGWSTHNDVQRTIRFLSEIKCFYDFF